MNTHLSKRQMVQLLASLAILPILAGQCAAIAQPTSGFNPPDRPLLFTRRLTRELGAGAAIDVFRSFEIRFIRSAAGFRVEGREIGCDVSAPPALAALAEMERKRQENGLFPMQLDSRGLILKGPQGRGPSAPIGKAVNEALAQIAESHISSGDQANAREFVFGLQMLGARITGNMPRQLFVGMTLTQHEERELPMPDGNFGTLTVTMHATTSPDFGLIDRGERVVVTQFGESRRRWVEKWALAPLPIIGR